MSLYLPCLGLVGLLRCVGEFFFIKCGEFSAIISLNHSSALFSPLSKTLGAHMPVCLILSQRFRYGGYPYALSWWQEPQPKFPRFPHFSSNVQQLFKHRRVSDCHTLLVHCQSAKMVILSVLCLGGEDLLVSSFDWTPPFHVVKLTFTKHLLTQTPEALIFSNASDLKWN